MKTRSKQINRLASVQTAQDATGAQAGHKGGQSIMQADPQLKTHPRGTRSDGKSKEAVRKKLGSDHTPEPTPPKTKLTSNICVHSRQTTNQERPFYMSNTPLNDHEKQMLAFIAGVCYGCHGYPIKHGLPSQPASRLVNLHFLEILNRGITPPTNDRTADRTLASLLSKKLLTASGSTKDRRVRLSREGVFMAWALNGEPASQLQRLYSHAQKQITAKLVTMKDETATAVYSRSAGFSDNWTALQMLGLVEVGYSVDCKNPLEAFYSVSLIGTLPTLPNDSDLPAWCEELKDAFNSGVEEGERLAISPLGSEWKNECQSLKQARIASFNTKKAKADFQNAKGNFSLDSF